jgi:hypothetical protein
MPSQQRLRSYQLRNKHYMRKSFLVVLHIDCPLYCPNIVLMLQQVKGIGSGIVSASLSARDPPTQQGDGYNRGSLSYPQLDGSFFDRSSVDISCRNAGALPESTVLNKH